MFCKISVVLNWYFYIMFHNIMETSANPVELQIISSSDMGYQLVNTTNLLAYQGSALDGNQLVTRNKRWLEELFSYFYDSDEEDSSSEEEGGLDDIISNDKGYGICRNCTVTYNQVSQVQHINRVIPQTIQSLPATIVTAATPKNGFDTKPSKSQTTEGTKVFETTSPNEIQTTNTQQVDPITQESAVTSTETPKEIDASTQVLTSTEASTTLASAPAASEAEIAVASTTLAAAPASSEAEIAVTTEASTTLEPATAAVITEAAPIVDLAETTA